MQTDMRLIDANKLVRNLTGMLKEFDAIAIDGMIRGIENAPIIESEPVRHGRWARKEKNHVYWHECSECGERPLKSNGYYCQSAFCPFCGAKMDEKEEA